MPAPVQSLKLEKLIQLFFTSGLPAIPIVKDDLIRTYLTQEKVERRVYTDAFFKEEFITMLPDLTERMENRLFFEVIDRIQPPQVPVVDSLTFSLDLLDRTAFNTRFRPLTELVEGDYRKILEDAGSPILVFNTRHELIFRNKACRRLLHLFQNHLGGRRPRIEEYLPEPFFRVLDRHDSEKPYELTTGDGTRLVRYRLGRLQLTGGEVVVVTFLLP